MRGPPSPPGCGCARATLRRPRTRAWGSCSCGWAGCGFGRPTGAGSRGPLVPRLAAAALPPKGLGAAA
eukprot:7579664-Lingulodinium_polyedra.AAC.1